MFGYHALQLGLPELDALGSNRMPHRWLALSGGFAASAARGRSRRVADDPRRGRGQPARPARGFRGAAVSRTQPGPGGAAAHAGAQRRPARHPARGRAGAGARGPGGDLRPQSRPACGACASGARTCTGAWGSANLFLPDAGEFIGYWRLRDWLRLLEFRGRVRPLRLLPAGGADRHAGWSASTGWTGRASAGGRSSAPSISWSAVKRVRGMRLLEPGLEGAADGAREESGFHSKLAPVRSWDQLEKQH